MKNLVDLNKIYNEVDELTPESILTLFKKLININTSVPPGNMYREYVDAISPYFKELGYSLEEVIVPEDLVKQIPFPLEGPRVNLVATKDFGQQECVSFYGHMDVVPVPEVNLKDWRFPPFQANMIKSGKIYGRGVADMKGSMACLILALQIIDKLNLTPKYNIRILNCTDEEIGIWPGVRYLKEKNYIKGFVFCMDTIINPIILVGHAGNLNVTVETIGRSCHSGMNFLGVNALEEMVPIMEELLQLKKTVEVRESIDIPGVRPSETGERMNMTPMFNLNIIRSGEKENIIPNLCTLTINRRVIPDEDIEEVRQEIEEAIERGKAKSKALDVKISYIYKYPALKNNLDSHALKRLKKVMQLVQDIPEDRISYVGDPGSTDMGFISEYDIINHGVANPGSNDHGINETIKLRDIRTFIKELIVFLYADL
ncbi:MAG: M20 family peptidase [Promethearchaeota archaeon]|nr:MAG: M20 family peptidase [Candidatus Lokiarchaeota archaeon]